MLQRSAQDAQRAPLKSLGMSRDSRTLLLVAQNLLFRLLMLALHSFELPNHGLQTFQGNSMNSNPSHASPTPVARLNSLQPNNGSGAFGNGRLGHADRFGQFHARRTLSASNVYPPQAFHYDPNPLFTHSYTRSFAYGGGHNYVYNNPGPASDAYLEANTIRPPSLGSSFSGNFRQLTPMTNISGQCYFEIGCEKNFKLTFSAELGESSRNDDGIQ